MSLRHRGLAYLAKVLGYYQASRCASRLIRLTATCGGSKQDLKVIGMEVVGCRIFVPSLDSDIVVLT